MLEISNLVKTFKDSRGRGDQSVTAVNDVSLRVEPGQLYTLLGPSGCGKTTTLRCVAGLETPDSGRISVADRVLYSSSDRIKLSANERGLGMVFQSYAVWPHMDVFHNVSFPLDVARGRKRLSRANIRERVERVLAVVQLEHLKDRRATDLSGGQQQRLALARALVMEPPLLLLDEPLSNLDAKLRENMRFELKRLQTDLGITAVYVTHDQLEALAMSSVIAVLNNGMIEQVGKPREIYERPATKFVANFIGTSNFLEGSVVARHADDSYEVQAAEGRLLATSTRRFSPGDSVTVSVRPESIELSADSPPETGVGTWQAEVISRAFLGEAVDHLVRVGEREMLARCNPSVSLPPGTKVTVRLRESGSALLAFDGADVGEAVRAREPSPPALP